MKRKAKAKKPVSLGAVLRKLEKISKMVSDIDSRVWALYNR